MSRLSLNDSSTAVPMQLAMVFLILLSALGCEVDDSTIGPGGSGPKNGPIVYVSSGGLRLVDADGDSARTLIHSDSLRQPRWSPGKSHIAFVRERQSVLGSVLRVVDSAGSTPVSLASGILGFSSQPWSPDGTHLLVTSVDSGIVLVTPSGPPPREILPDAADGVFVNDSEFVALRLGAEGARLLKRSIREGVVDSFEILFDTIGAAIGLVSVSVNARQIGFAVGNSTDSLTSYWIIGSDGLNRRRLIPRVGFPEGPILLAHFSPDGRQLLAIPDHETQFGMYIVSVNSGGVIPLTGTPRQDQSDVADWSPDGHKITFVTPDGILAVINTDGSGVELLADEAAQPDW